MSRPSVSSSSLMVSGGSSRMMFAEHAARQDDHAGSVGCGG